MRILIVEDEPDLLSSLAQALREEGYAVDTANDGEDGFYKAENYDYDAVVLDVMLPKMDGWQVLARPCSCSPHGTSRAIACAASMAEPMTM